MSYLQRIKYLVRHHGPKAVAAKCLGLVGDRWFDWRHGVDNNTPLQLDSYTIVGESRQNATSYGASRFLPLRRLFRLLRERLPGEGVFVDFGCGNGKVLLVAAYCGVRRVRGVEFARELCNLAKANWARFCARTGTAPASGEFFEGDVATYACQPDETMYFIYNPFDKVILEKVLANLNASLHAHPRPLAIIICNPDEIYQRVMREHPEFPLVQTPRFWGYPFFIYMNQPG